MRLLFNFCLHPEAQCLFFHISCYFNISKRIGGKTKGGL
nr:MAG TPA: hypothetical protein [Bacteriophage sp.]